MSQISTGSCSVTNGSGIVTFDTLDLSTANIDVADIFKVNGDAVHYYIGSITTGSPSYISLTSPYQGTTADGVSYIIHNDFSTNLSLPLVSTGDRSFPSLVKEALLLLDDYVVEGATSIIQTTDATQTTLASLSVASNTVKSFIIIVSGISTTAPKAVYSIQYQGVVKNITGTVEFVGTPIYTEFYDADASSWSVDLTPDGSDLDINVTGEAGTTINWSSRIIA